MCIGGTDNGEQEGPNLYFKEPVANGVLLCLRRPRRRMTMVKYTEMSELHSPERILQICNGWPKSQILLLYRLYREGNWRRNIIRGICTSVIFR